MSRCNCCKGTGWKRDISGKGLENIPESHRPPRIYKCPCCEGTGEFYLYKEIKNIISPIIIAVNIDMDILIDTLKNIDILVKEKEPEHTQ